MTPLDLAGWAQQTASGPLLTALPVAVLAGLVSFLSPGEQVQVIGDSFAGDSPFHVSQINLNDRSVEGLRHRTKPIETVQYHPEGAPGPLDALAVFDRFVATMAERR